MSSESELRYANMDEKKRRRMISNRESARRSRMKKQQLMEDLTVELGRLQLHNNVIKGKMKIIGDKYTIYDSQNHQLRAELKDLTHRLTSLNHLITMNKNKNKTDMDADEMSDHPMLKRWHQMQIPCSKPPSIQQQLHLSIQDSRP